MDATSTQALSSGLSGTMVFGSLACLLYLLSAMVQFFGLRSDGSNPIEVPSHKRKFVIFSAIAALLMHGVFSFQEIYTQAGINIGIYPMASLTTLAIVAIVVVSSLRRPVENLLIVLLPIATISVALTLLMKGAYTPRTDISTGIMIHIVLSVIANSLLAVAAFEAAFLSLGDYEMKHRNIAVLRRLPPLQTMESLLFELLWTGLIFLSLSIISGFIFLDDIYDRGLIHHTSITFAAWIVFAVLLWGRFQLGWRGTVASRWTLAGFGLLLLGYFGSKLVLELVLNG